MKTYLLITMGLLLSACTWVNENPQGQSVAIINGASNCPKAGTINVSTKYKITFIKRSSKKVQGELQTLARNEALKINANTISPINEPVAGKQSYTAYTCPR